MLAQYDLPLFLWPEAVAYAVFLKNRSPTRALAQDITPDEAFLLGITPRWAEPENNLKITSIPFHWHLGRIACMAILQPRSSENPDLTKYDVHF
ncbi:hypothetical protein C8R42DRAFT_680113 [Lentinula raphanica]|nr:hypothetical protein C8R42DRAFT_680113 [Lentinula raphanica]